MRVCVLKSLATLDAIWPCLNFRLDHIILNANQAHHCESVHCESAYLNLCWVTTTHRAGSGCVSPARRLQACLQGTNLSMCICILSLWLGNCCDSLLHCESASDRAMSSRIIFCNPSFLASHALNPAWKLSAPSSSQTLAHDVRELLSKSKL